MTTRITSYQIKQFCRFVEDASNRALREVGPDKDGLQRLIERGGEFQAYVVAGIKRFTAKAPNYELVKSILGKDFISPEEIATARGVTYTDEQLAMFSETIPAQEVLEWCRDNDMMLVAGPPTAMSLLDIRALTPDYFYSKGPERDDPGWYDEAREKFARNDKVERLWIAFLKDPLPNSFSKNWSEQEVLVAKPMTVSNAAEVAWCVTTYKAVRGAYLLPNVYVRTSSIDPGGLRVSVGDFDAEGLFVRSDWDNYRNGSLGLASARKF